MMLPDEVRDRIRDLLWERATNLGWSGLADVERSRHYEQWTRETAIGGTLAHYMDARKVRVYIKDSLLKPYERARMSDTEQDILAALAIDSGLGVLDRYIKPHGMRFIDGQIIAWGKSRDWKLILMAMYAVSWLYIIWCGTPRERQHGGRQHAHLSAGGGQATWHRACRVDRLRSWYQ
jgi:hypothetical protein